MWQMFKGVIKSLVVEEAGRVPNPHSFITFATSIHSLPRYILHPTSPSVFRERECSHLFLSHYIWESGRLKAQIWSLIGAKYERLPMFYGIQKHPFVFTAAICDGFQCCVLHQFDGYAVWYTGMGAPPDRYLESGE